MQDTVATIESVETISPSYRRMKLKVGWDAFVPGQFVMVRVPGDAAFIRRPFGIVGLEQGLCEICFKVVGSGTEALAAVQPGEALSVLGPVGNGFKIAQADTHVLVAGGYGIAPIVGLARVLQSQGASCLVGYGAASAEHLLYLDELRALGCDLMITTEDGSEGSKGLITDFIATSISKDTAVYCCGPEGLMKAVAKLGEHNGALTQVSMDRFMACGIGLCLGCVCETVEGTHVRACREGPVFDAKELQW